MKKIPPKFSQKKPILGSLLLALILILTSHIPGLITTLVPQVYAAGAEAGGEGVSGIVFYDTNNDGLRDMGEEGVAGIRVTLYNADDDSEIQSSYTDNTGIYTYITGIPGNYYVIVDNIPTNYAYSPQDEGADDTGDSDVNASGETDTIVVAAETLATNVDAGVYLSNSLLGDFVFDDLNEDGIQDSGELGIAGVDVALLDHNDSDAIVASTQTDSDGLYTISTQIPGCTGPNFSWDASLGENMEIDCAIDTAGGEIFLQFTTDAICDMPSPMQSTSITLLDIDDSTLYTGTCGGMAPDLLPHEHYSILLPPTGTGIIELNIAVTGMALPGAGFFNIFWGYSNFILNFDTLPTDYQFTEQNAGGDITLDSNVDSDGNTDILVIVPGEVYDTFDAGAYLGASEEEEEEEEESSGSGSTSTRGNGGGSTSFINWGSLGGSNDDGGNSWVRGDGKTPSNTRSQNTLPASVQTYTPCLVAGRSAPLTFQDISANADIDFLTSITFLNEPERRLIKGYGDGTFGMNKQLTRFELLKIALSSNCAGNGGTSTLTTNNTFFSDVPTDDSEKSRVIGEGHRLGIITGINDKFYPDNPVSYAEMIKILFHASAYFKDGKPVAELEENIVGLTDQSFHQAVAYAQRLNILPFTSETPFPQNTLVTRNNMISILANFIRAMQGTVMV